MILMQMETARVFFGSATRVYWTFKYLGDNWLEAEGTVALLPRCGSLS